MKEARSHPIVVSYQRGAVPPTPNLSLLCSELPTAFQGCRALERNLVRPLAVKHLPPHIYPGLSQVPSKMK